MNMQYVCHTPYSGKTMVGTPIDIKKGDILERINNVLVYKNIPVCIYRSLAGKMHFSNNTDGNGLERGALTYALAYADRFRQSSDERKSQQRFTDDEIEILETKWYNYLKPNCDVLLFNDNLFEEYVDKLKEIAKSVNIHLEETNA